MKIKPPEFIISEENPFANDKINRKESVEILTQLISTLGEPFVIAIDSPWGTGKSTFIKMWMQDLKNNHHPYLYFSAWENDFSDDPFVSLIGEIGTGIETIEIEEGRKNRVKEIFSRAKDVGKSLVKKTLPVAIKVATAGVLDIENIYEAAISDFAKKVAEDSIDKYEESKKTIKDFKERLSEFVGEVVNSDQEDNDTNLIFFIDELDRCRPLFAIELLEKIKHLFNIEGIIFVLAIDKEQIGHSIRSVYGEGMDSDGYLRRFIDLDYQLPSPEKNSVCPALFEKFNLEEYFRTRPTREAQYEKEQFIEIFSELFHLFNFSLRVQEQCFSQFSLALRTTPHNYKLYPTFLGALIAIKAASPSLYKDFVGRKKSAEEIIKFIKEYPGGEVFFNEDVGINLEALLLTANVRRNEIKPIIEPFVQLRDDESTEQTVYRRAERMVVILGDIYRQDDCGRLEYLSKKIDMLEQFATP